MVATVEDTPPRGWTGVGRGIWKASSQITERAARELMADRLDSSGSGATASRVRGQGRASSKLRRSS